MNFYSIIAGIGAILTILQLSIGPFVQQIIRYETHSVNINTVSIPIAISYDPLDCADSAEECTDVTLSMKAAIMNAALDIGANSTDFDIAPNCPTGNCTWEPYQSLAVCSKCADLRGQLDSIPIQVGGHAAINWTLPNGMYLLDNLRRSSVGLVAMIVNNTAATEMRMLSVAFPDTKPYICVLDLIVIVGQTNYTPHTPGGYLIGPFAAECVLELCVQSY